MSEKCLSVVKRIVVDSVDSEFHVSIASDDGGSHYCIHIPWGTCTDKLRSCLDSENLDTRYIILFVPDGYIKHFLKE
jgi:hypothetical protein